MSQTIVRGHVTDQIGNLVFSNPKKHNALPQSGWLAVASAVESLIKDGARVIIVRGDGASFCAGADISEFDTMRKDAASARIYEQSNIEAFAAIRRAVIPTIAQISGYCLGGGFGLAAACDLRVAAKGAAFGVPAAKLGLGYPVDAMADIVNSIGQQNTKRLLFTGEHFSSDDLLKFGFLMEVVAADVIGKTVGQLAVQIANLAPLTHKATKTAIEAAFGGDRQKAIITSNATFTSKDYEEGRQAFREKRSPRFKGD